MEVNKLTDLSREFHEFEVPFQYLQQCLYFLNELCKFSNNEYLVN